MHFVEENVSNISIDDSIERTDHNNTEYIFDNSSRSLNNELLEKDYNECQDDNNKVLHSTFTDSIERTYNNTEYIIDNPTKSLNNELLEKDYNNCQDNNSLKCFDSTTHKENSDSEYCPSEHSSILIETESNNDFPDTTNNRKQLSGSNKDSNNSGFEVSIQINNSNVICPDDTNLNIDPSEGSKGGNKKNCCFYCRKMQSKIARHLATVHRNKPEVKKFIDLCPNNLERKKIIETIRRNGNFIYNTNSNINEGKLLVCRRPRKDKQKSAKDYTACAKCKGFFVKTSLRRHFKQCTSYGSKQTRSVLVMGRAVIGRINPIAEETLRKVVFPALREDEITRLIRYDELIIMFGNRLCRKYRKQYQHKLIRSHLRYLGRFLKVMRDLNAQVTDMKSIFQPTFYEDCIKAVNRMSAFDDSTNTYKVTTTPQLMGTLLKKVGNLLITQSIKKKDYETKKDTEEFLALLVDDFPTSVNKAALEAQEENRRCKKRNYLQWTIL
ncbi:uncharacterized protein LOC114931007 [Nylanderia fulva]|uniref:uncharacterized protein LOC114931007 n=1 Tax=Nylanderia fulva TaxID=613905 RepID=UPI0010FBB944|nr:uncharacterized protein LOC114931007 [Nylanderia fulva]